MSLMTRLLWGKLMKLFPKRILIGKYPPGHTGSSLLVGHHPITFWRFTLLKLLLVQVNSQSSLWVLCSLEALSFCPQLPLYLPFLKGLSVSSPLGSFLVSQAFACFLLQPAYEPASSIRLFWQGRLLFSLFVSFLTEPINQHCGKQTERRETPHCFPMSSQAFFMIDYTEPQ